VKRCIGVEGLGRRVEGLGRRVEGRKQTGEPREGTKCRKKNDETQMTNDQWGKKMVGLVELDPPYGLHGAFTLQWMVCE
jgi:hypothetical protein